MNKGTQTKLKMSNKSMTMIEHSLKLHTCPFSHVEAKGAGEHTRVQSSARLGGYKENGMASDTC